MREEDARKLHRSLKSGDMAGASEVLAQSPALAKSARVRMIPRKIIEAITEDDFARWAESDFAGKNMPPVKLDPREMHFLSGGYGVDVSLCDNNDSNIAQAPTGPSDTQVASNDPSFGNQSEGGQVASDPGALGGDGAPTDPTAFGLK